MSTDVDPWVAWSGQVNKRLRDLERLTAPHGPLVKGIGHAILEGDNSIRRGVGLPLIKRRVRVKAGTAPWP